jgi:hypothetical protein
MLFAVIYLLTIGEEDEPGSGLIADLDVALGRARVLSDRVKRYAHWRDADVRVWEAGRRRPSPGGPQSSPGLPVWIRAVGTQRANGSPRRTSS